MFNLEHALGNWRRHLIAGGFTSADALDELESHLRDDIETQVRLGVDVEQAFELAVRHLGAPRELSQEFARSGPRAAVPQRTFLRYSYFLCATVAVVADVWTLVSFELSPVERVGASAGVTVFALYLLGSPFFSWWKGGIPGVCLLRVMKTLGVIVPLWTLWALLTALRIIHVEIGIVPEMAMWSLCAAYGLTGLAWVLKRGSGKQSGSDSGFSPLNPAPRPIPPDRPGPPDIDIPLPPTATFTQAARRALEVAREEALNLGHDFIGTEHVLLGVLKTAGSALAQVLQRSRVSNETIREEIHRLISALPVRSTTSPIPPLTPRACKALQFAVREAGARDHSPIGTEHIFQGLLLEGGGVAAVALKNLGVRLECSSRRKLWGLKTVIYY